MQTDETRILHVISHRSWLAEDMSAGSTGACRVRGSLGFDVPTGVGEGDAVWAPMEWAARARPALGAVGLSLPLADPGPGWLTTLPKEVLRRGVDLFTFAELERLRGQEGFIKPANAKIAVLPAQWARVDDLIAPAREAGVPDDADFLFCQTRLGFTEEHRTFVLDGQVVATSPYLIGSETYTEGMHSPHERDAVQFAEDVLGQLRPDAFPPAFVMDIGLCDEGEWVVLEANPAWCSNPYGADPAAVLATVLEANTPGHWDWKPDAYLLDRAARHPLRIDTRCR